MSKKKPTPGGRSKKKAEVSLVRSSAAEYLTFVAASGQGGVEAVYADENVWLTQKMMGLLYAVETQTINYHLKKVFADQELVEESVIRNFRITAADGKTYDTQHYNLSAIIAVGYKVNSERAVQFRKWATGIIESFTIKGARWTTSGRRRRHAPSFGWRSKTNSMPACPAPMTRRCIRRSARRSSNMCTRPIRNTAEGYSQRLDEFPTRWKGT